MRMTIEKLIENKQSMRFINVNKSVWPWKAREIASYQRYINVNPGLYDPAKFRYQR